MAKIINFPTLQQIAPDVRNQLNFAEYDFAKYNDILERYDEHLIAAGSKGQVVLDLWERYDKLMQLREKALKELEIRSETSPQLL